jgi:hypothetical protein
MSGLLARGFTLLCTGGQFPSPAAGWLLRVDRAAARLLAPDGTAAYNGGLVQPRFWLDLVERRRGVLFS